MNEEQSLNAATPSEPGPAHPNTAGQQNSYPAAPRPGYFSTGRRELVYAAFLLLASLMAADGFLWTAPGLLASAASVSLALISGCYLLRGGRRITGYGLFCFAAFLACGLAFTFTDGGTQDLLLVLLMFLLAAAAMLERTGLRQYPGGDFRAIADICYMVFALTFGKLGQAFYSLLRCGTGEKRRVSSILLGIAIAIPVLLIVLPLLISSDAAFAAMLDRWLGIEGLCELFFVLLLGGLFFLLLFGRLISLPRVRRSEPPEPLGKGLDPAVVVTFLSILSALYALYLFSQLAYFFNAFSGLLPEEFTVAQYARRGFFEMTLICAVNLGLVFLSHLSCRKTGGRTPLSVRLLSLFLCIFSLILSATVLAKLRLYIASFGMTQLRIVTSVFTVFLIVVFLAVALRLFVRRVPYMKIAFAAAVVLSLVCAYADVDRVVAHHNIDAYLSGSLETLDTEALDRLHSDAIVEDVLRLIDVPDEAVAQWARAELSDRADRLFDLRYTSDGAQIYAIRGDWRAWNTVESEARELLAARFDEFYQNHVE